MREEKVTVNDKTYVVKEPSPKIRNDSRLFSAGVFRKAADQETPPIPRDKLPDYMKKLGLWDDTHLKQLKDVSKKLADGELQIKRGGRTKDGKKFTKEQCRKLCIDMQVWRVEQINLLLQTRAYDHMTLEGIAENATFDYLVSRSVFYENGRPVFSSYDDYLEKSNEEYAAVCAKTLSEILYGSVSDFTETQKQNSENQFLVKYGFARESDLRLIDKDGDLVDENYKKINEDGYLVDEDGNVINTTDPEVEFTEFED